MYYEREMIILMEAENINRNRCYFNLMHSNALHYHLKGLIFLSLFLMPLVFLHMVMLQKVRCLM